MFWFGVWFGLSVGSWFNVCFSLMLLQLGVGFCLVLVVGLILVVGLMLVLGLVLVDGFVCGFGFVSVFWFGVAFG